MHHLVLALLLKFDMRAAFQGCKALGLGVPTFRVGELGFEVWGCRLRLIGCRGLRQDILR